MKASSLLEAAPVNRVAFLDHLLAASHEQLLRTPAEAPSRRFVLARIVGLQFERDVLASAGSSTAALHFAPR